MALISCKNVEFQYDGKTVLSNVSFDVNKGDYLCIVGENGSGKTTLMNGILGIIKAKNGEIKFDENITNKEIGYLPQQTEIQKNFPASVYEVVLSGCINKLKFIPFYTKREKKIANTNMELLEITDIKNKCYHNLSGGQQQRVLLARALCSAKSVLLLDEPVAGLDPVVTNSMYKIIKHLNTEHKITVIMVSHDIKSSVEYATHILHLGHKPLFYGTTADYLKSDIAKSLIGGEKND